MQFAIINFVGVFINRFKAWEKEVAERKEVEKKAEEAKKNILKYVNTTSVQNALELC